MTEERRNELAILDRQLAKDMCDGFDKLGVTNGEAIWLLRSVANMLQAHIARIENEKPDEPFKLVRM